MRHYTTLYKTIQQYIKLYNTYYTMLYKTIDRFHSRDRWPQWGGETIRNI